MTDSPTIRRSMLLIAMLSIATVAIAQYSADNRVNPQLYPTGGAQNYRPNDYSVGESIYYRTPHPLMLLPSEALMAEQRSGALPSELLMEAQQAGPLNPYGAISYIPGQSPLQRMMRLPPPQLYNPAYHISAAFGQPSIYSPAAGSIHYNGTLRSSLYGPWPPSITGITPQPTHTFSIATSQPIPSEFGESASTGLGYGSIYFSSINPPPSTQAAGK